MEPTPSVDYQAVLEDLRARRASLDAAIEALEQLAGTPNGGTTGTVSASPSAGSLRSDTFFGMGIGDAAVKYLGIVKAPKNIAQIMSALEQGGLTHTSKNFYSTVFTALARRAENEADITRVKRGEWGLTAWYPGLRKGKKSEPAEPDSEKA
jgi:hypothetical protein